MLSKIFLDISGSMGVTTEIAGGIELNPLLSTKKLSHISRLQCLQTAVHSQINELRRTQPNCIVALISFSNDVTIYG